MDRPAFVAAKSRVAAELKMLVFEVGEMGLDADTAEFVSDGATRLMVELDRATEENQLERVESGLGRLQVMVRQAQKRSRLPN